MTSVSRALSPVVLALTALALAVAPARGADPAFRKLAKSAESTVRGAVNAELKAARQTLKQARADLASGQSALPAAMDQVVTAITAALTAATNTAVAEAEQLRDAGADLLADSADPPDADFQDGGGGAWDRYKQRAEFFLGRADARLALDFARFVKVATKLAQKQDDFDPDVRARVHGHARAALAQVPGPVLAPTETPEEALSIEDANPSQILIEVRFLTVEGDLNQELGVDWRGIGDGYVRVQQSGSTPTDPVVLDVDDDGAGRAMIPLTRTLPGALLTELMDVRMDLLQQTRGSLPTGAADVPPVLAAFRKRWSQELKFAGKVLKQGTNGLRQSYTERAKLHGQGQLSTANALRSAVNLFANPLGNDCFSLTQIQQQPVNQAVSGFQEQGLQDDAVSSEFQPDGGGFHTRALARLGRKLAATDRTRARLTLRFMTRISKQAKKQGQDVGITLQVVPRVTPDGNVLQIGLDVAPAVVPVPTIQMGFLADIADAGDSELVGGFAGESKSNLVDVELATIALEGDTQIVSGLPTSGAYSSQLPLLGDVPVLGRLFRARHLLVEQPSLLIFTTPRLLSPAD